MIRAAIALVLLPIASLAQLQLFLAPEGGSEQSVTGVHNVGSTYTNETISTRFRIRNMGASTISLTVLHVAGTGFSMTGAHSLPRSVAPGANVDFTVHFRPPDYGSFSANLQINGLGVLLRGTGNAAATLYLDGQMLQSGSTIDFGRVERGQGKVLLVEVRNTTRDPVGLSHIVLGGEAFSCPSGNPLSIVQPGENYFFQLRFAPTAAKIFTGALTVDRTRVINLTGTGLEPAIPRPLLTIETPVVRSAQQGRLGVRLESVSRAMAKGRIRIELQPAPGARDNDAAVQFLSGGRIASFEVREGSDQVVFSDTGATTVAFQAGTTAGTLVFILEAGGFTERVSVAIDAQPVVLDRAKTVRTGSTIEVELAGFDNTRTANSLQFTFFTASGQPLAPITVNTAGDFAKWWESSALGGIFSLRAAFPVTGDATQVKGVEVQILNSIGTTRTDRLAF